MQQKTLTQNRVLLDIFQYFTDSQNEVLKGCVLSYTESPCVGECSLSPKDQDANSYAMLG